jgi:hypothetical protein
MKTTGLGRQPDFLQGFLQVDDDLAAVREGQGDHGAHTLVVNIGVAFVIHPVTVRLQGFEQGFGLIQIFEVGHYNFTMLNAKRILVSAVIILGGVLQLSACGQTGSLYLPTPPAATGAK